MKKNYPISAFYCYSVLFSLLVSFNIAANSNKQTEVKSCSLIHNVLGYTSIAQSENIVELSWMAFSEGKIIATSAKHNLQDYKQCDKIDGNNRVLLPGLIDAHGHVSGLGHEMLQVNLRGAKSEAAAVERVQKFEQENKQSNWILGRGWNQVLWLSQEFPNKQSLDLSGIKRPIFLSRVDGHAAWANSKALEIAGITRLTPDPQGGKIIRDDKGNATGVLVDNAIGLVEQKIPAPSKLEREFAFDKAFKHLLSLGIVSVHDAGVNQVDLNSYLERLKTDQLPVRIYAMLDGSSENLMNWLKAGIIQDDRDRLSVRSVKLYSDGALGSRGAALLAPYSDDVDNKGLLLTETKTLNQLVVNILKMGFQVNVHAIGDRGNRLVLDAFEAAFKTVADGKTLRNRIEHAQIVALDDIPRFKQLNIIASMQPVHATSDKNMAGDRLGAERLKGAYAWQKFIQQGTIIASGSDFPVELANVFHGIHAAVTRQDQQNQPEQGWLPDEKMMLAQAIRSFTLDAAFAAHQENSLGSLEVGKWADFILVDQDIFKSKPENIWKTQVQQTWIAGIKKFDITKQPH